MKAGYMLLVLLAVLPVAKADSWDDFFNNLATDLAPLLALFGEQVTKQYISESLDWVDNFIFCMAPLGILTAIVSAIRVCGTSSLRAFIGRAQEGRAMVEAELLSCTSHNVCELWNDGGIARVFGRPMILELVHYPGEDDNVNKYYDTCSGYGQPIERPTAGLFRFRETIHRNYFRWEETRSAKDDEKVGGGEPDRLMNSRDDAEQATSFAPNPNLSLNVGIKWRPRYVSFMAAVLGVTLQTGVLLYAGLIVYRFPAHFPKNGGPMKKWAFPLMCTGTVLLCSGMFLCAHLVERSTLERVFKFVRGSSTLKPSNPKMYWLQPGGQTVGDQMFDAFAWEDTPDPYLTSWKPESTGERNGTRKIVRLWIAVTLTVIGFVVQFVGLRGLHSSVALFQLGSIAIMALVRASLRMKRSDENMLKMLRDAVPGHELDWLAMRIEKCTGWDIIGPQDMSQIQDKWTSDHDRRLGYSIGKSSDPADRLLVIGGMIGEDHNLSRERKSLKQIQSWGSEEMDGWEAQGSSKPGYKEQKPNLAVRVLKNRARLARLTGSELASKPWEFRTRYSAQVLQQALEEVINLVYAEGFELKKDWDRLSSIIWGVKCNVRQESGLTEDQTVHLVLRRTQDAETQGAAKIRTLTPWKSDEYELQALLGLWSWSLGQGNLRSPCKRLIARIRTDAEIETRMDYKIWIQRETACEEVRLDTKMIRSSKTQNGTRYIGWQAIDVPSNADEPTLPVLCAPSTRDIYLLCQQAIFTSFLTAISTIIDKVGGETTRRTIVGDRESFRLSNSQLDKIAKIFVNAGLGSLEDAYMCIIPSLMLRSKLPVTLEAHENARSTVMAMMEQDRWEDAAELLRWILSNSSVISTPMMDDARRSLGDVFRLTKGDKEPGTQKLVRKGIIWMMEKMGVDATSENSDNPFLLAAKKGDEEVVRALRKHVKNPDCCTDKDRETPLSLAAFAGHESIVRLLLDMGANPQNSNARGVSPLMHAARYDHASVVALLLDKLPAPEFLEEALCQAAAGGSETVVRMLIQTRGVPPKSKAVAYLAEGATGRPSRFAGGGENRRTPALLKSYEQILTLLLQCGVSPDPEDYSGLAPILQFAESSPEGLTSLLLKHGANPNRDSNGTTALGNAALAGRESLIALLLDHGAHVDPVNSDGDTPLYQASYAPREAVARLLLERGASPKSKGNIGPTPLTYFVKFSREQVVELLLKKGANVDPRDEQHDRTPLIWAASMGNKAITELLLNFGADANIQIPGGLTALISASFFSTVGFDFPEMRDGARHPEPDYAGVVELLLQYGAEVNIRDEQGKTALMHAVRERGNASVARILVENGADIDAADEEGNTPRSFVNSRRDPFEYEEIIALFKPPATPAVAGSASKKHGRVREALKSFAKMGRFASSSASNP